MSRRFAMLSVLAVCCGCLICLGCAREGERPDAAAANEKAPTNVVMILVDTLRADHLSAYGYSRVTTPNLDRFGAQAALFERNRSQASCTFPSVNSLLTSRNVGAFLHQRKGLGIPDDIPSLAEILHRNGFATAAVSASPIVRMTASDFNPEGGFGRGFDAFDESCLWDGAQCVNRRALELLDELPRPFFLYLHYMDPHDHYAPPADFDGPFSEPCGGPEFICAGNPNPISSAIYNDGPPVEVSDSDIRHLIDLYDDEIAHFDLYFGRLMAALEEIELASSSIVVVVSDHGEEFLEHGHVQHCRVLYDSSTRTPLMIRIPGLDDGVRIGAPVQNLDITPTVLDALDLDPGDLFFNGRSLLPLLHGGAVASGYAFSRQGRWRSIDNGRLKLIMDARDISYQLYDLDRDPPESTNRFDPGDPAAQELVRDLHRWLRRTEGWGGGP